MNALKHSAMDLGYNAYFDGKTKQENPYDENTQEAKWESWEMGWERADSLSDDD